MILHPVFNTIKLIIPDYVKATGWILIEMFTKEIKPSDISLAAEVSYCDKGFKYIVKTVFHQQKHNKSICSS